MRAAARLVEIFVPVADSLGHETLEDKCGQFKLWRVEAMAMFAKYCQPGAILTMAGAKGRPI